ncbi:MAG: DegV family protein [Lachnospiraceae bacterium]|nr:DegV family protein [Lachnospiraceae bacterium]
MKRDYVIIADTTNDLPMSFTEENGIDLVPLLYEIDGQAYGRDCNLTPKEFYDKMREGAATKTAAANIDEISEHFEPFLREDKDIIFMCLSSGISSTASNAFICKSELEEKYPEATICVIDSLCASGGQGMLLYRAIQNKKNGMTVEENYKNLEEIKMNIVHKFTVEDLKYLQRGGRISKAAATIGTMINLKPLLHVDNEGKLVAETKVRGRKKSLQQLVRNMGPCMGSFADKQDVIIICHADVEEDAKYTAQLIEELYHPGEIIFSGITPTIGAHSGPGTIAIFFMGDVR